jgi:hypothetical protein
LQPGSLLGARMPVTGAAAAANAPTSLLELPRPAGRGVFSLRSVNVTLCGSPVCPAFARTKAEGPSLSKGRLFGSHSPSAEACERSGTKPDTLLEYAGHSGRPCEVGREFRFHGAPRDRRTCDRPALDLSKPGHTASLAGSDHIAGVSEMVGLGAFRPRA